MTEQQKEESQKTVVAFIVGLIIGGLLVWAFGGNGTNAPVRDNDRDNDTERVSTTTNSTDEDSDDEEEDQNTTPTNNTLPVGDGSVSLNDQTAGKSVKLASATFPVSEGWVGVRDYNNGQLGGLLGVARFSEAQGLVPTEIILQRATVAGREYAIVFYTENGDRQFSLANDVQLDDEVSVFTAE